MGEKKSELASGRQHVYGIRYKFIESDSLNELNRDVVQKTNCSELGRLLELGRIRVRLCWSTRRCGSCCFS